MHDECTGARSIARRLRARAEAADLLKPLIVNNIGIDGIIQCGLGDWAEGPVLLSFFPPMNHQYLAIEPIHRYCYEVWGRGFRGPIIQGALWCNTGEIMELSDFRTQTSALDKERRLGKFSTSTVTLDDAVWYTKFNAPRILLWMDIEGVELVVLQAAERTLSKTVAIVCELKDKPRLENWPNAVQVIEKLKELGYNLHLRIKDNGLFMRKDISLDNTKVKND